VELNKTLIRKRDWSATTISQGSQVEIVEFVGGG
jgi:thiamine biosynthesis protein ThiS